MIVKGLMEIDVKHLLEIEGHVAGANPDGNKSKRHGGVGVKRTMHWEAVLITIFVLSNMSSVGQAADILKATYAAKPARTRIPPRS